MDASEPTTKEQAIVGAAWRLFVANGFAATSMDAIAREADVSKATLYAYFSSKDALFARVVGDEGERHSTALARPACDTAEPIAGVLRRTAGEFSRLMLSADNMGVTRMIVADAAAQPGLGRRFFAAGPDVLIGRLAERIEAAMVAGELRRADSRIAAGQFIGLILGELHLRMMLGAGIPPSRLRHQVAEAGLDSFLRAYARCARSGAGRKLPRKHRPSV